MGYLFLLTGIAFGVTGQMCVKMSKGFERIVPSVSAFLSFIICMYFISMSVNYFEIGIVFAIWSGLTIVATTLLGIILFGEAKSRKKIISITSILIGVLLLKMI